jgi:hypothetical protein
MALEAALAVDDTAESVIFEFTVQNGGDREVELTFPSGKLADVTVLDEGETVWRWSDDRLFTQAIETAMLAPGESFTERFTWDDSVPGEYEARATLAAQGVDAAATQPFSVSG